MVPRWLLRIGWAFHKRLFAITGGRIGAQRASAGRMGTLFLVTTGRRSGERRRNAVFYLDDDPRFVVVASNAGSAHDPGWVLNLQAHPDAFVQLGPQTLPVHARRASAEERARLWPRLVERNPAFADYERSAGREIPVVVLEPR
jgi:F420H(2)-dependent quinone reductase